MCRKSWETITLLSGAEKTSRPSLGVVMPHWRIRRSWFRNRFTCTASTQNTGRRRRRFGSLHGGSDGILLPLMISVIVFLLMLVFWWRSMPLSRGLYSASNVKNSILKRAVIFYPSSTKMSTVLNKASRNYSSTKTTKCAVISNTGSPQTMFQPSKTPSGKNARMEPDSGF